MDPAIVALLIAAIAAAAVLYLAASRSTGTPGRTLVVAISILVGALLTASVIGVARFLVG